MQKVGYQVYDMRIRLYSRVVLEKPTAEGVQLQDEGSLAVTPKSPFTGKDAKQMACDLL